MGRTVDKLFIFLTGRAVRELRNAAELRRPIGSSRHLEHGTTHVSGRAVLAVQSRSRVSSHNSEGTKARGRRLQGAPKFFMSSVLCAGAAKVFRYHLASVRPAMGRGGLDHRGEW